MKKYKINSETFFTENGLLVLKEVREDFVGDNAHIHVDAKVFYYGVPVATSRILFAVTPYKTTGEYNEKYFEALRDADLMLQEFVDSYFKGVK